MERGGSTSVFSVYVFFALIEDVAAARPVRSHVHNLQTAVQALTANAFTDRIEQADAEISAIETHTQNNKHPCSAYKLHTGFQV